MSIKATIFVEGKTDKKFINDFLQVRFADRIQDWSEIQVIDGKDNLRNYKNRFKISSDSGLTNLLIFDADNDAKIQLENLNAIKGELNIDFEVFLFPNNHSSGNLESLLKKIATTQEVFECIQAYGRCLNQLHNESLREIDDKTSIFIYSDSFKNPTSKGHYRDYTNENIWNLNSEALSPLYDFLSDHID